MKPKQYWNYLIWFILVLGVVTAEVCLEGKDTLSSSCNENVLNQILDKLNEINKKVEQTEIDLKKCNEINKIYEMIDISNKLNEISKKVEMIDIVNKKVDMIDGKLMSLSTNSNTLILEHLIATALKDNEIQESLKTLNRTVNDMHKGQLEQTLYIEKQNKEITNQSNAQRTQIEELTSLVNKQKIMHKNENQTEQASKNFEQKYENISLETKIAEDLELAQLFSALNRTLSMNQTSQCNLAKEELHTEFQYLKETIRYVNRTLDSIADYLGPSFASFGTINVIANKLALPFASCTTALQLTPRSGVYRLKIPNASAYCLYDPAGGMGWTVIQRREDGSVSFNRNWHDYKYGFGDLNGEYWLGLEKIYALTSKGEHELWIELGDHEGQRRQAKYAAFEIGNEAEKYYLKTVGAYTGNAGDSLGPAKITRKFTTFDEDNDADEYINCVRVYLGAWWHDDCANTLNGEYNNNELAKGVNWFSWRGWEYSLKYAHMAIRPAK